MCLWVDFGWSCLRYGCTIRQYVDGRFYRFSTFERNKMLTTRRFFRLVRLANDGSFIKYLEDKRLFNTHFPKFICRKWFISKDMSFEQFTDIVKRGVIVKPLNGMEGDGIYRLETSVFDSKERVKHYYEMLKQEDVLVEELIHQHTRMNFNNNSVNTIRVISIMEKDTHAVKIIKTVLRAGVGESIVDNYHQGGCCYEIDVESGRVCSAGISRNGGGIFHPGTDICMLGYQIPNWKKVIDGCIEAHRLLPQCRYISWDVAITEDGIELVEGNHNGDYDMLEFVGSNGYWPLLKRCI